MNRRQARFYLASILCSVLVACGANTTPITVKLTAEKTLLRDNWKTNISAIVTGDSNQAVKYFITDSVGNPVDSSTAAVENGQFIASQPGTYIITAKNAQGNVQSSPLTIEAVRGGTGLLWAGEYYSNTLRSYETTSFPPVQMNIIGQNDTSDAERFSLAFDAVGNLWISNHKSDAVYMILKEKLSNQYSAFTPDVTLTVKNPAGLTFDDAGNLWVSSVSTRSLVRFAKASQKAGGTPDITVTLNISSGCLDVAFDTSGNLWMACRDAGLAQLSTKQFNATSVQNPRFLRRPDKMFFRHLAFDKTGNLWVTDRDNANISRYNKSTIDLEDITSRLPDFIINTIQPAGIAFDSVGNLWISQWNRTTLQRFSANTLIDTPPTAPDLELETGGKQYGLAFSNGIAFRGY